MGECFSDPSPASILSGLLHRNDTPLSTTGAHRFGITLSSVSPGSILSGFGNSPRYAFQASFICRLRSWSACGIGAWASVCGVVCCCWAGGYVGAIMTYPPQHKAHLCRACLHEQIEWTLILVSAMLSMSHAASYTAYTTHTPALNYAKAVTRSQQMWPRYQNRIQAPG